MMLFGAHPLICTCLALLLAVDPALVAPKPVQANILTKLLEGLDGAGRAGGRAARSADELLAAAVRAQMELPGTAGVSVLMADGQTLKLVIHTPNETLTKGVRTAGEVTDTLTQVGISVIYIPEEFLARVQSLLASMQDVKELRLLRKDSTIIKLEKSQAGRLLARLNESNLFVDLHSIQALDTFAAIAGTRVSRSQVDVYSLFDPREIDVVRYLDRGAGDAHHALKPQEVPALATSIASRSADKLTLVVGHIEATSLVMRGTRGEVLARFPIDELESSMARVGRNVLILGCESGCVASGGYLSAVNVKALAEALSVVRFGGTHGELLTALAKASPDGLVVTSSFLDDARLFVAARAKAEETAQHNQAVFNRVRMAAAVPSASTNPLATTLYGFLLVLQIVGLIWLVGFLNCVFQLKVHWRSWNDRSAGVGNGYAGPFKRRVMEMRNLGVFLLVFPYMVAAEVAYQMVLLGTLAGPIVMLVLAFGHPQESTALWLALAGLVGYALLVLSWRRRLRARPLAIAVHADPSLPMLGTWRDYLALYAWTIGLPLILAVGVTALIAARPPLFGLLVALQAVPLAAVAFVLLVRTCRQAGIGPYELPIAAAVCLYQWLRWSRNPQRLKLMWVAFVEAWRDQ
jgi:hypothetical protein